MAIEDKVIDPAEAMRLAPVEIMDWLVIAPLLISMLGACVGIMMRTRTDLQSRIAALFLTALVLSNIGLLFHVLEKGVIVMVMGKWLAPFGIAFAADATSVILSLTASIVAWSVGFYGAIEVDHAGRRYGFYPFLLLLMVGVSGSFLTGDIFNLYVWFEVMLISSFGLLILGNKRVQLDGALKYGVLNLIATTLFLIATGLLYAMVGTLNMADIAIRVKSLPENAPLVVITALYTLAFAIKAAAFPVNFWLPASYHTPKIVVSAVFAGLLTKVAVYALLRTLIMIVPAGRGELDLALVVVAILTMLTGVFGSLAQTDIRRAFGFLVISGVGIMLAGLALGSESAVSGSIFYAVHSIIVMTALYLVGGVIGRITGTFDLRELGGLYKANPLLAAILLIIGFAIAGLPPFSGFWPKVILVHASLQLESYLLSGAILLTGFLTTISVGRIWLYSFWRNPPELVADNSSKITIRPLAETVEESTLIIWIPILILIVLIIVMGISPEFLFQVVNQGAADLVNPEQYIESVLGVNP